ncbi:cyclase family protein [Fundicoccus culcitae]|uniref:Cyclase family protein n=1 Tax=Fundicoccus culcitae TaxID=2969821 RepID=A0ABY5P9J3_9LACT|nr:cyclase family protein [Fundicoccus culcitae]UUX35412.1 cyclase family protein [Fundicoccus culcitae]
MSEVQRLLEQLKGYRWVNLTHEVDATIPIYHTFNPLQEKIISTIADSGADSREYTIGTSHGTHIDAPKHFAEGKRGMEEIGLKERVLPLYVIHLEDKVKETPGYAVTVEDIQAFEAEHGVLPEGCFVAFSSGWYKRFYDSDVFKNTDENDVEHTPGWSIPALEYLSRTRHVTAIGHETLNTDSGVEAAEAGFLEAELYWLAEDKYQVELMANLDQLPAVGSVIFVTMPHIKDAPGFPVEVFAIVPEADVN